MGIHTAILGIIVIAFSIYLYKKKINYACLGFGAIGLSLFFSFLMMIKSLSPYFIGILTTIVFFVGCCLIVYDINKKNNKKD
jgi:hypothetical protein